MYAKLIWLTRLMTSEKTKCINKGWSHTTQLEPWQCSLLKISPMDWIQPLHTQATRSDLDSDWELNIRPSNWWERTSVFDYTPVLLSTNMFKVCYINLLLHGWLVHLMRESCGCAIDVSIVPMSHWMLLRLVENTRGRYVIILLIIANKKCTMASYR